MLDTAQQGWLSAPMAFAEVGLDKAASPLNAWLLLEG